MVAPRRRTSRATKLLKIMLRMLDLPEPDFPMRRTFFLRGLLLLLLLGVDMLACVVGVCEDGRGGGRVVGGVCCNIRDGAVDRRLFCTILMSF